MALSASRGEWVVESIAGADNDSQVDFKLTNGETITPLLSFSEDDDCPIHNIEEE